MFVHKEEKHGIGKQGVERNSLIGFLYELLQVPHSKASFRTNYKKFILKQGSPSGTLVVEFHI